MEDHRVVKMLTGGIIFLSTLALFGFAWMSYLTWRDGFKCSTIASVPICYLHVFFTALLLVSQIYESSHSKLLFWLGLMVPFTISLGESLLQINGLAQCSLIGVIPMCYLVLGIFALLIVLNRVRKSFLIG